MKKKFFGVSLLLLVAVLAMMLSACDNSTKFTTTFNSQGGSQIESAVGQINNEPTPSKADYAFEGWYENSDCTGTKISFPFTPTADTTLYAKWTLVEYTVVFQTNNGSAVQNLTGAKGTKITFEPVTTRNYHDFGGWYTTPDFSGEKVVFPYTITQNITLYAKWIFFFGDGSGVANDPFTISTKSHFEYFRTVVNNGTEEYFEKYFVLTSNIDLEGTEWTPIGRSQTSSYFKGTFDGKGFTISNFQITVATEYAGLFGAFSGTIKNLRIENFAIDIEYNGNIYAGGLIGYNSYGVISNCYTDGNINIAASGPTSTNAIGGGLVGYNFNGTIKDSYATGNISITANDYSAAAGGLVGFNSYGSITNSYAKGSVNSISTSPYGYTYASSGGLVGYDTVGTFTNCYATGEIIATSVNSSTLAGGFAGSSDSSIFTNCFALGSVNAICSSNLGYSVNAGGLIGSNDSNNIIDCYAMGNITATTTDAAAFIGGLAGYSFDSTIISSYSTGNITVTATSITAVSTQVFAGGISGYNNKSSITNCYASGNINASASGSDYPRAYVGGLVGTNNNGSTISQSYAKGNIYATLATSDISTASARAFAGGLAGDNIDGSKIIDCYAEGNVDATTISAASAFIHIGGLIGLNTKGIISNCYAIGNVSSTSSTYSYTSFYSAYISSYSGGLIGQNDSGIITNCYAAGDVSATVSSYYSSSAYAGGLVGENFNSTIKTCYAAGDITASATAVAASASTLTGGFVGNNYTGEIINSYAEGNVSAATSANSSYSYNSKAGGFVGENRDNSIITNCYATGNANATSLSFAYAGGFAGSNMGSCITKNCFATGNLSAISTSNTAYVGGLVGFQSNGTVTNCYYYSGQTFYRKQGVNEFTTENSIIGTKVTEADFASTTFYTNTLGWDSEVWDFTGVLSLLNGPKLKK